MHRPDARGLRAARGRAPPALSRLPGKGAKLDITVETRDPAHAETVLRALVAAGFAPPQIEVATVLE